MRQMRQTHKASAASPWQFKMPTAKTSGVRCPHRANLWRSRNEVAEQRFSGLSALSAFLAPAGRGHFCVFKSFLV
jgi:hypothetical protein